MQRHPQRNAVSTTARASAPAAEAHRTTLHCIRHPRRPMRPETGDHAAASNQNPRHRTCTRRRGACGSPCGWMPNTLPGMRRAPSRCCSGAGRAALCGKPPPRAGASDGGTRPRSEAAPAAAGGGDASATHPCDWMYVRQCAAPRPASLAARPVRQRLGTAKAPWPCVARRGRAPAPASETLRFAQSSRERSSLPSPWHAPESCRPRSEQDSFTTELTPPVCRPLSTRVFCVYDTSISTYSTLLPLQQNYDYDYHNASAFYLSPPPPPPPSPLDLYPSPERHCALPQVECSPLKEGRKGMYPYI